MKGQWKTVEAIVSGVLVLMFVAVLSGTHSYASPGAPSQGYMALYDVYAKGTLRQYAADMDTQAISSEIESTGYLSFYNHTVVICNESACTGSAPDKEDVWTASVLLSGGEQYDPMEVILYIYRKG
jgi:hypothetical protein